MLNNSELDNTRFQKEEISKEFYEIESKRNKVLNNINEINKKKEEADRNIKVYDSNIQAYQSEMRIKESRLKFLIETEKEKEGYVKSVRSLLLDCEKTKDLGKGMHGVLANIIEVPEKYQTAIEMCLGMSLQNIVTETEEDAKRLVEHLRKNNLGRASFLPISSVHGKKLDKIKGNENGIIGIASDLVKYNKKYEQIITNLLGRTVIVDNMNSAINVAKQNGYSFRIITVEGDVINPSGAITGGSVAKKTVKQNGYSFRIITVEGDVINPSGAITGGSVAKKTVNILGRGREIEKLEENIKELSTKIEKQEKQKEEYNNSIEDTFEEAILLEKELQEIDITYATEKQKLISVEENIEKIEKRILKLKEEQETIKADKEKSIEIKNETKQEIEKLTDEIEKLSSIIQEFANKKKNTKILLKILLKK